MSTESMGVGGTEASRNDSASLPLVSVIIPSFNHAPYVERAVKSVWTQDYPRVELIVIDDASTDGSAEILLKLQSASPIDMRVVIKPTNSGVSNSLNAGIALARGEWLGFLASDDEFRPEKCRVQMQAAMLAGGEFGCVHSDAFQILGDGRLIGRVYCGSRIPPMRGECFQEFIRSRVRKIAVTCMVRTALARDLGGFDESMVAEDFDFYLRLSHGAKVLYVDAPLVNMRILPGSLGRSPHRWIADIFRAIAKFRCEFSASEWEEILVDRNLFASKELIAAGQFSLAYQYFKAALVSASRLENSLGLSRTILVSAARELAARVARTAGLRRRATFPHGEP